LRLSKWGVSVYFFYEKGLVREANVGRRLSHKIIIRKREKKRKLQATFQMRFGVVEWEEGAAGGIDKAIIP